ncbi:MAG: DUF3179 domain-containing protein [Candidatus Kariarchaeaceae archaeon]|jgi:hypothetical protein
MAASPIMQFRIIRLAILTLILLTGMSSSVGSQNSSFLSNLSYIPNIEQENQITPDEECAVPCNRITSGGPPPDGIPSIDNPIFLSASDAEAPSDTSQIIGVEIDGVARAYPYDILNWHEIVNDEINGQHLSITYCPLTKSGILYHTEVLGNSELGTSGSLYENNLVFYDRNSDSWWSQMLGLSLTGENIYNQLNYSQAIETTWGTWKKLHPNTVVLSRDTGFNRDYNRNPYAVFQHDDSIWFGTTYNANTKPYNLYHKKALTVVLRQKNNTKLLPFEKLGQFPVLNHQFEGLNLVTLFDQSSQTSVTFSSDLENGTQLSFFSNNDTNLDTSLTLDLPIFQDTQGNIWNFKGEAINGSRIGQTLKVVPTYNAFWYAATSFFYNAEIFADAGQQKTERTTTEISGTPDPVAGEPEVVIVTEIVVETYSVEPSEQTVDTGYPQLFIGFSAILLISIIRIRRRKVSEK